MWRINSAGSSKAPEAAHAMEHRVNCRLRAGGVVLCFASDFGFVASLGRFSA